MGVFFRKNRPYEDEELVEMLRKGGNDETKALDHLYQHLRPAIVSWVQTKGGTEADGKDAFQLGLLALCAALQEGRFSGQQKVRAYIWQAAKNAWYMRCRKWGKMDPLEESLPIQDPGTERWLRDFIHDELHKEEILAIVYRACPGCLQLIEQQFYHGLSNEALAHQLGQKVSSVKVKRSRCLRSIREYLAQHPEAVRLFDQPISIYALQNPSHEAS